MKRQLLLGIGDDPSVLMAVRFVSSFFEDKNNMMITLFSSYSRPAEVWEEEKNFETLAVADKQADKNEIACRVAQTEARRMLMDRGFDPENLDMKCSPRFFTKSMDIVQESEKGLYDAVVLGRRGAAGLEGVLEESVSRKVMLEETGCPIWVCRHPDMERKGVLLCIDGSEPCYRMADHVGFMLRREPKHDITLFHVLNGKRSDQEVEAMFTRATNQLLREGIEPERIRTKVADGGRPVKMILKEAVNHAVVAGGRTGADQTLVQRMFIGSASLTLLKELDGAALWFCR